MYNCSVPSREIRGGLDEGVAGANSAGDDRILKKENEGILENRKKKLEVKYMQCLKEFYLKNDLMNNNCDIYVKEYEKMKESP
jgi:hypothetical protein